MFFCRFQMIGSRLASEPRVLSLMECSHPALPVDVVAKKNANSVQ